MKGVSLKVALISGVNGQDGSYLSELLIEKGYKVYGIIRRSSVFTTERIDHLDDYSNFETLYGDVTDSSNLRRLIHDIAPDEIYNLAAQSHVAVSFDVPEYTAEATGVSTLRFLDAIRDTEVPTKFYQASTSELFGGLPGTEPQSELTPFHPKSPYGVAKLYAYWITVNYRENYQIFASNGILFNHESPRRTPNFVTRKITKAVADIVNGKANSLYLGNLDARRDWGHAKDYVEAMWLILQQKHPKDYVIATGKTYSVREFATLAFQHVGIELEWIGSEEKEVGVDKKTGKGIVFVDPKYYRPSEVEILQGDASLAKSDLGWEPKISLTQLISEMVDNDIKEKN